MTRQEWKNILVSINERRGQGAKAENRYEEGVRMQVKRNKESFVMDSLESNKIKLIPLVSILFMIVISFFNLFGLNIAGLSVILGVAAFFINKAMVKQPFEGSGLDLSAIGTDLKDKKIWFWITLPLIMDIVCLGLAKAFLPQYIAYETGRAGTFVPIEITIASALQFLFFALGEEIAWRAFFQQQLNKVLPIAPTLLLSSVLFTLGHFKAGDPMVVFFNLFFILINSVLYGIVFHKTKNAWVSTVSHYVSNMFSVIVIVLFF